MRAGRIIEAGLPRDVLKHPREHYTRKILAAAPSLDEALELRAAQRRVVGGLNRRLQMHLRMFWSKFGGCMCTRRGRKLDRRR